MVLKFEFASQQTQVGVLTCSAVYRLHGHIRGTYISSSWMCLTCVDAWSEVDSFTGIGPDLAELEATGSHVCGSIYSRSGTAIFSIFGWRLSIDCNNAPLDSMICVINMIS
jgi:hypothetical protein